MIVLVALFFLDPNDELVDNLAQDTIRITRVLLNELRELDKKVDTFLVLLVDFVWCVQSLHILVNDRDK